MKLFPRYTSLFFLFCLCGADEDAAPPFTCSLSEHEQKKEAIVDPNLHEMTYDVGGGTQTTLVYVEPNVTTFYKNQRPPSDAKVKPKFNGLSGKFINMSNSKISILNAGSPSRFQSTSDFALLSSRLLVVLT